jgi:thiosulfate/3-mercaptopyruvate sulfurtransferase
MSRDAALVDADWAEAHLDDPTIVLIEVDEDTTAYDKGHIRGAIKLDWKADLQDGVRHDFISKGPLRSAAERARCRHDHTVVFYGGNNNWFAAYAYWQFKLYGHDDVKLLDGGRKKWELDGPGARRSARSAATRTARAPPASGLPRRGGRGDRSKTSSTSAAPTSHAARCWPGHLPQERAAAAHPHARNVPWSKAPTTTAPSARRGAPPAVRRGGSTARNIAYCRSGAQLAHLVRAARALGQTT